MSRISNHVKTTNVDTILGSSEGDITIGGPFSSLEEKENLRCELDLKTCPSHETPILKLKTATFVIHCDC